MALELDVVARSEEIVFGATGLTEIMQNVRIILTTMRGSVPLDRDFGRSGESLDAPLPLAMARESAEIVELVEREEPRVEVVSVRFDEAREAEAAGGVLVPIVRIRIKEGVDVVSG